MIVIGIGSNLRHRALGAPVDVCKAAVAHLRDNGIDIAGISPWYRSAPVGASGQPSYVNAVAIVRTQLAPYPFLRFLKHTETKFGRRRSFPNAPRILDLDLITYGAVSLEHGALTVPHPRFRERAFVLRPLADVAPDWRDPLTDKTAKALLAEITEPQPLRKIA